LLKEFVKRISPVIVPPLAHWLIVAVFFTMRVSYVDFDSYAERLRKGERIILAFWHGRLFMMPYAYFGNGISVLVSTHRDGELIARTVKRFPNIDCVRGSSTRGWISGVKGLLSSARMGKDLAITPDGPKGPGREAQLGAVLMAERLGFPIIPVSFGASRKKTFKSWDAFIIPYPFSKGVFVAAEPVTVRPGSSKEELEAKRLELEEKLNDCTDRADRFFERTPEGGRFHK